MKVTMICNLSLHSYSRDLCAGLRGLKDNLTLVLYNCKGERKGREKWIKNIWGPNLYPFQIFREVIKDSPDIVHIQHEFNAFGSFYTSLFFPILLFLLKFTRRIIVVTVHVVIPTEMVTGKFVDNNLPYKLPSTFVKIIVVFVYRMIALLVDSIIVHANYFKKQLQNSHGILGSKISVIPHGAYENGRYISLRSIDYWRRRTKDKRIILFFGHLSPRKGLEYLLRAYARITEKYPNYILILAGGEVSHYAWYAKKIQDLTEKLGLASRVIITGSISEEDVHPLFKLADFAVFPYTFTISSSGPVSYAIRYKKPIIASKIGVFRERLSDGEDCLLVPPKDVEALVRGIETLISNENLKNKFSRTLALNAKEISWVKIAQLTFGLYRKLCLAS